LEIAVIDKLHHTLLVRTLENNTNISDYEYAKMFIKYKYLKQSPDTIAWDIISKFE